MTELTRSARAASRQDLRPAPQDRRPPRRLRPLPHPQSERSSSRSGLEEGSMPRDRAPSPSPRRPPVRQQSAPHLRTVPAKLSSRSGSDLARPALSAAAEERAVCEIQRISDRLDAPSCPENLSLPWRGTSVEREPIGGPGSSRALRRPRRLGAERWRRGRRRAASSPSSSRRTGRRWPSSPERYRCRRSSEPSCLSRRDRAWRPPATRSSRGTGRRLPSPSPP